MLVGLRLKTEGSIKSVSFVRQSVRPFITALIFLIFGMKLGIHKGSIVTETLFLKKGPNFGENGVNLLKNEDF